MSSREFSPAGGKPELVMPVGQGEEEVVEFAWDTLILDRLLNGTITVKDVTGSQG